MDFVSDALFDRRRFRALTVVDAYTRECLAIEVDQGMKAEAVVAMMERLTYLRGKAAGKIKVDTGPEFISRVLDHWAYRHGVTLDFSRPGKPTDNAFAESFSGRLRDECLNTQWFLSLADTRAKIDEWRRDYNKCRSRTSLGLRTPAEFASSAGLNPADEVPEVSFQVDGILGERQSTLWGPITLDQLWVATDFVGGVRPVRQDTR